MNIIDAHCHLGKGYTYSQSAQELLRQMDNNHVASAIVVPVDRCIAVDNREGNDEILAAAKAYPDRFVPFATANPWYGSRALDELRRSFDAGAAGIKLHPVIQGFTAIDEILFPIIELAAEYRKPLYFHTGTPSSGTPYQLTELAMRYPEATLIMGHAAYSDFWNDVVASVNCVNNIYIETSMHLASFVKLLIDECGSDKLIYGSNAPHTSMTVEIEKITKFVQGEEKLADVFGRNIKRIVGLNYP